MGIPFSLSKDGNFVVNGVEMSAMELCGGGGAGLSGGLSFDRAASSSREGANEAKLLRAKLQEKKLRIEELTLANESLTAELTRARCVLQRAHEEAALADRSSKFDSQNAQVGCRR